MTCRNLLLILDDSPYTTDLPTPIDRPSVPPPSPEKSPRQQPYSNPTYDSFIPLTIIVLLSALFVIAFFSLYVRCFSGSSDPSPSSPPASQPPHRRHGAPSKGGADSDVLRSLPVVGYGGGEHPYGHQSDCAVCLSEFEEGETVKVIPRCRHVFHPDCLDTWLSSHVSCPLCRAVQLSL